MADDATVPDDDPKNFYDLERAAETAAKWPLLQAAWQALGGSAPAAPRRPTYSVPSASPNPRLGNGEHDPARHASAAAPKLNGAHALPAAVAAPTAEAAPPEAAPRHGEAKPQTLEELFGRMR